MTPKIESLLILAKFDDGVVRQVITDKADQKEILSHLIYTHQTIRVIENVEGIDWECSFNLLENN